MSEKEMLSENLMQTEGAQLKDILYRMGEFIAYFEVAESRMFEWKKEIESCFTEQQGKIKQQIDEVYRASHALEEITTAVGAARWRLAAEEALKEGKEHLHAFEALCKTQADLQETRNTEFMHLAKKSFERLDRAANHAVYTIKDAVSNCKPEEYKKLADKCREALETTGTNAIQNIKSLYQWFHWKTLAAVTVLTLVFSFSVGFYLNDEMPWETHQQVAMQRSAGKALIDAWPTLSTAEKERILQHADRNFV